MIGEVLHKRMGKQDWWYHGLKPSGCRPFQNTC
jgi:hypothetical protein